MKKNRLFLIYLIISTVIFFSGCSSKSIESEKTSITEKTVMESEAVTNVTSATSNITQTSSQASIQVTSQTPTQAPSEPPTLDIYTEASNNKSLYWSYYNEVLTYVNGYRSEIGAAPLVLSDELCMAASVRATEMLRGDYFEHLRPDGRSWTTVLGELSISYSYAGENIAKGYGDVAAVCNGWYGSSGHYNNMINSGYGKMGVGIAFITPSRGYWVQIFTD